MQLICGDCLQILKTITDNSVDSVVTDCPYELGFMGKEWDRCGISFRPEIWRECLRVLKPGGYLLAFGGTRTYHRIACAIEDAGFEIRDMIQWLYSQGFPKSLNLSKAIDAHLGEEREILGANPNARPNSQPNYSLDGKAANFSASYSPITKPKSIEAQQWDGWGTALKPANEPICLARKPIREKTVAENVLKWGTGGINIDVSRIKHNETLKTNRQHMSDDATWNDKITGGNCGFDNTKNNIASAAPEGRFPANIIFSHDENCKCIGLKKVAGHRGYPNSPGGIYSKEYQQTNNIAKEWNNFSTKKHNEAWDGYADTDGKETVEDWQCVEGCAIKMLDEQSGITATKRIEKGSNCGGNTWGGTIQTNRCARGHTDSGGASRFFYCAKVSTKERNAGLSNTTNCHPTVKPIKLMRYLIKLITPPNGVVLDPFMGSGSTGIAACEERVNFIGIEKEIEYFEIAKARIENTKIEN